LIGVFQSVILYAAVDRSKAIPVLVG